MTQWSSRGAAAFALLAGFVAAGAASPAPARPTSHVVRITEFAFSPAELRAGVGDTVAWENADILPHTTAADSGAWASTELPVGSRFQYVASDTGRFPYHCAAHPTMHGVLIVR